MSSQILIQMYPGVIAMRMRSITPGAHRHHAIQLTVDLSDEHAVEIASGVLTARASVIEADVTHSIRADRCLILLLEPESKWGRAVRSLWLNDTAMSAIPLPGGVETAEAALAWISSWIGSSKSVTDERVLRVLEIVQEGERTGGWPALPLSHVARAVNLSSSRFRHVFVEEMGISWRRYILWRRLLAALRPAIGGASLTEAAHAAGFADSAHLTRTCRSMFGIVPSEIARYSRFIQAGETSEG